MSTRSGRIRTGALENSPKARKGVSPSRSPARNRRSSPPARSPSRKSPSRKSPSRKPASKFPARKSPSRTTKDSDDSAPKSPAKRQSIKTETTKSENVTKIETSRVTRGRRSDYSIKDVPSLSVEFGGGDRLNGLDSLFDSRDIYGVRNRKGEDVIPRRSGRIKEFMDADIKRSMSKSVSKSVSQSLDTFSDEDNSEEDLKKEKSKSVTRKLATPIRDSVAKMAKLSSRLEFGGPLGSSVFIALLPFTIFSILISCTHSCSLKSIIDISTYKSPGLWFSVAALSYLTAQYLLQALIACIPILGTRADRFDDTGKKYTFNAFFATIVTVTLLFTLDFFKVTNSSTLLNDYLKLSMISYVFAVLLSTILYWKGRKQDDSELNPYGNTGYTLYDFWMGKEIHAHFKQLNIKIWISRVCNINTVVLSLLVLKHGISIPSLDVEKMSVDSLKDTLNKIQYKPTIIVYAMMQLIYALNFILREYKITTTFYWQSEGVGYLQTVSSALYPFYFTTISKFVLDSGIILSTNTLIISSAIFLVGIIIMIVSNNIKYQFRINPLHPSLTHLDSMPTFHGKKLLLSNLWGLVRHPNYAGDILIHIALSLPGILSKQYVAGLPALLTLLVLGHRAWRDHGRCRRRYGAAWQRYCKRVPSLLIPKIL